MGPVAHGGHCVVRLPQPESRVVFVRHTLPGERVVLELTEGTEGDRFWRGDAVEVLEPSPDRVPAPCPYAGPGVCGGCDFQHVTPAGQRRLKAAVVREQLDRLAGLDLPTEIWSGEVEAVTPDDLRWRTRMRYVALPDGKRGLHSFRSDEVVDIEDCLIDAHRPATATETVETGHGTREFVVDPDGFWQSHLAAPRVLVETVLELLDPRPGEKALDLYAGVGLFAGFLADVVGPTGRVVAVEGSRIAGRDARTNLAGGPTGDVTGNLIEERPSRSASVECGQVDLVLASSYDEPFDLVVLDPPREGARRTVVLQVADRAPRSIAYVACDPAALARDLATFAEAGYRLTRLRAFDLFPMTHHVECVALLERG